METDSRYRSIYQSLLFLLLVFIPIMLPAQGWPQPQGEGFYKVGTDLIRGNKYYDPGGITVTTPTRTDFTVSFYGEYGVTNDITTILYLPVKRSTLNRQVERPSGFIPFPGDEETSLGDIDLGVKFGLLRTGSSVLTAGLKLGLPTGNADQINGLYTGDGEFNQLLTTGIGHSFYPLPAYTAGHIGLNNRTEGYSDEFIYGGEFGYTIAKRVLTIARINGVESLKNGDEDVLRGNGGLAQNQRYLSWGLQGAVLLGDMGLTASFGSAFFAQNTQAAPMFSLGFFLKK